MTEHMAVWRSALQRLAAAESAEEGVLLDSNEVAMLCYGIRVMALASQTEGPQ